MWPMTPIRPIDNLILAAGGLILLALAALLRFLPENRFGSALRSYFEHGRTSLEVTTLVFLVLGFVFIGMSIFFAVVE